MSVFPEQIDTFQSHYDVGATDIINVQRYQTLRTKDSLTSAEAQEMNTLYSVLRDKLFLAEDFNKLQDAITNLETFFKYQTETYISQLFTNYDLRMLAMELATETRLSDAEKSFNAQIVEMDKKITETEAWQNDLMAEMYDSQYFDFDNIVYKTGFTRKTEQTSDTESIETIYNTIDGSVFATRKTTKNKEQDYTVQIICDKVVPAINSISHTYKKDGTWFEDIVAGT